MIKIGLVTNVKSVVFSLQQAEQDVRTKAMVRALNKMADQVKVQAARSIQAAGYKLKSSVIKKGLRVDRATPGKPVSAVVARGRPIPLIEFSARETGAGVSVAVLNGRKVIKGAFIATMPNGHRGVYTRTDNAKHRKFSKNGKVSWHALPINQLFGPGLPDSMANAKVTDALERLVDEKFAAIFEREVAWINRRK